MALIKCIECGAQISDKAAACVRCGAPVARNTVVNALPVSVARVPRTWLWYWWLWGPLGLFAAFLILGAMLPERYAKAAESRRICQGLARGDPMLLRECDRIADEIGSAPESATVFRGPSEAGPPLPHPDDNPYEHQPAAVLDAATGVPH